MESISGLSLKKHISEWFTMYVHERLKWLVLPVTLRIWHFLGFINLFIHSVDIVLGLCSLYCLDFSSKISWSQKCCLQSSVVVQWLRICLAMQGTLVQSLVQEDRTWYSAAKPVLRNYWACVLEPGAAAAEPLLRTCWSPWALEPMLCNRKSPYITTREQPLLSASRESPGSATKTQCSHKEIIFFKVLFHRHRYSFKS